MIKMKNYFKLLFEQIKGICAKKITQWTFADVITIAFWAWFVWSIASFLPYLIAIIIDLA